MGKQERAARLKLVELLINAGYYAWTLYRFGTWDLTEVGGKAFGHLLLTCILIGLVFEALNHQILRRHYPHEVLEDERDRSIRSAGTGLAFKICVAGLFTLVWLIYIQPRAAEHVALPAGLLAHVPLLILALAYAAKYGLEIWLYRRDRLEAVEDSA